MPKSVKTETLDELAKAFCEAMLLEERFDISEVLPPPGLETDYADVRMIRYLLWSNSRYLAHHHIPEWRLGVAVIARAGPHIFLFDTEGVPIDKSRLKLLTPPTEDLRRLFPDTKSDAALRTRIVETAAAGLDWASAASGRCACGDMRWKPAISIWPKPPRYRRRLAGLHRMTAEPRAGACRCGTRVWLTAAMPFWP